MFAERFDALMNIAEISNSLLARAVHMNSSYIGRLRTGARPLPKKHDYLEPMCLYLAEHIKKDYQQDALQKLTGIGYALLTSQPDTALYLKQWLLDEYNFEARQRLSSVFTRSFNNTLEEKITVENKTSVTYSEYLYGNGGKRKGVEQFFLAILQEKKPQTIYLFSDENMAWMYEDPIFAKRWAELFGKVISIGNKVQIIHTISRDMNELLEAVAKWIPIYATGGIEPYFYPRLRDDIFQRTLFIAPKTAAVVSSSVKQNTDGMLNLFITNKAALEAVTLEYQRYFALCRPLMKIFTDNSKNAYHHAIKLLKGSVGDVHICSNTPPLFTMPLNIVQEIAEDNQDLLDMWRESTEKFKQQITQQKITLVLLDPQKMNGDILTVKRPLENIFDFKEIRYAKDQYLAHIEYLKELEKEYSNLTLVFKDELKLNMLLYVKEGIGVVMAKTDAPSSAFVITERNMVNAFEDYFKIY